MSGLLRGARRVSEVWWKISRPIVIGVQGLVVDKDGQVMLVKHTYVPGWHFPGGGVGKGETLPQALVRELAEEVGVRPVDEPKLVSTYTAFQHGRTNHIVLFRIDTYDRWAVRSREIAHSGFYHPLSPPSDTSPGTARRLQEIFGGAPVSPLW